MRSRLERVKPLDANVEKDGAKEVQYDKDSYDYLFDDSEIIDVDKKLAELQAIDDDDKAILSAINEPSDGISIALEESEKEELWSASDLGKYTIGTPSQLKQSAQNEDRNMQPISDLEFQEISDDIDPVDAKMQETLKQMVEELEGIF